MQRRTQNGVILRTPRKILRKNLVSLQTSGLLLKRTICSHFEVSFKSSLYIKEEIFYITRSFFIANTFFPHMHNVRIKRYACVRIQFTH